MRGLALAILLVSCATPLVIAQNATFVAAVDPTTVGANEQFQVSFTVSGPDINGAKNFQPPNFGQLVVLSGPNQSTSVQMINGKVSGSQTYSYYLYARQPGKYTIGAASIDYAGTTLRTQPLQLDVVKGQARAKSGQGDQTVGDNLFIRATADRQRVKQGEQVTITYKLFTRIGVSGYDLAKAPVYQGFWSEEIEQPNQPTVTVETYEGKQYRVATIRKTALFPTQTGKLTVSPLEVRCAVQLQSKRRSNDPFDSFFNDPFFSRTQTVEQDFKSNPLTISVDPLPGNAPPGFNGAVGNFAFSASLDKKEVAAGDPLTLRLTVSGAGNIKLLTLPKPTLPVDFEAYDPKISDEIAREGGIIKGKKIAEYLIIPRNPGQRAIEPISFSYFDLRQNTYSALRSPRFDITVTPASGSAGGTTIAAKSDIRLLGEDIRYLKLSPGELRPLTESPFGSAWFGIILFVPPALFVGTFLFRKRQEKLSGNVQRLRFAKAGKEATKRLKQAKKLFSQGNTESYHAEISRALMGYLEDKLHIDKASLSLDEAAILLARGGVSEETAQAMKSCMDRAEFSRFAPASDTKEARAELLETATGVINNIEKSFRGQR
jgi:hypothetical protein